MRWGWRLLLLVATGFWSATALATDENLLDLEADPPQIALASSSGQASEIAWRNNHDIWQAAVYCGLAPGGVEAQNRLGMFTRLGAVCRSGLTWRHPCSPWPRRGHPEARTMRERR